MDTNKITQEDAKKMLSDFVATIFGMDSSSEIDAVVMLAVNKKGNVSKLQVGDPLKVYGLLDVSKRNMYVQMSSQMLGGCCKNKKDEGDK